MNGLEYILGLYNMQHIELAEKLGIRKQNINLWIKGKQNIPKKYLPVLEELFGLNSEYFIKELNEIERLEIQKEKLKRELKPVIKSQDMQFMIGDINDLVEVPVYDKEEINAMERAIEKAKLVSRFKAVIEVVDENPYLDTFKLIVELLEKAQHEVILHKTIEALGHYHEVLPDWINSEPEQEEFESEIFEVFDDHNY
ncbi:helix-turn-helix domain-containing protein [Bacillus sp. FSL K6-0273]|uniref:helix-turn-helix domain-containing protein n=1 Tax=Bacillus cereus group TaxID=86661 RepID=UPI0008FD9EDC|nr:MULTISPECIES: helix-turn-helix domain-containing protein [Bacillus cereus group]MCU5489920.1 helix-turn-helix domain-containing protein [Bacillus cereus]MDF9466955.1 helix-turn-helix domain-containing protein [Bacillus cereus]OJD99315.1 transcriptional regulator [Bacillus thuringiensis]PFA79726.1 helix-turn-helix domain-containing protein [Bacillus thuringiensis]QWS01152.1 helix-turn-helix domain-containing protein [Bacillus cereus]